MATDSVSNKTGLVNVRPFMGQIRRKARQVVMHNELDALKRSLSRPKDLERVRLLQSLVER